MITTIEIKRRICLESKFLDSDIENHIFNKITDLVKDECTKEYGYITKVIRIVKIVDMVISQATTDNVINVIYEAETIKPEKNSKMNGVVCMIYEEGIFIDVLNKFQILIPSDSMVGYTFDAMSESFKKKKKTIEVGDTISVRISESIYDQQKFTIFGIIIDT